ncbi:unnamed protein product [Rhodiola kirilowii]
MFGADSDKALYNALLLTLFLISPPSTNLHLPPLPPSPLRQAPPPRMGPISPRFPRLVFHGIPTLWLALYLFPRGRHAAMPLISNPSSSSRPTSSTTSIALSSTPSASSTSAPPRPTRSQLLPGLLVSTA